MPPLKTLSTGRFPGLHGQEWGAYNYGLPIRDEATLPAFPTRVTYDPKT